MHEVYYYANASLVILQARVNPRVQIYVRASVFTMNKRQHRNKQSNTSVSRGSPYLCLSVNDTTHDTPANLTCVVIVEMWNILIHQEQPLYEKMLKVRCAQV